MPAHGRVEVSDAPVPEWHGTCETGGLPALGPLLVAALLALAATAASVFLSEVAAALVVRLCRPSRARRRAQARATEAGWLAARAQTWFLTPAPLGGPADAARGFRDLTVADLGLCADPQHPTVRHTASGAYRLLPVPPCAALHAAAERLGAEASVGGGLLVVGMDEAPEDAVAVLVLGPLVQIPLDAVPWTLVRALTTPRADPLVPAAAPAMPTAEVPMPRRAAATPDTPQRARRLPSWRSPKPTVRRRDRAAVRVAA